MERCNCTKNCKPRKKLCKLRVPLVLIAADRNPVGLVEALHKVGFSFNMSAKGREPLVVEI